MEVLRCTDDVFAHEPFNENESAPPPDAVVIATFPRPATRGMRHAARARTDGNAGNELSGMVGESSVMGAVFNQIRLVDGAAATSGARAAARCSSTRSPKCRRSFR